MLYNLLDALRDGLIDNNLYRFVMVFDQVQFRAIFAALLAFGIVVGFGKPVIRWLTAKKIGDAGLTDAAALEQAAASKKNTPTMGGILIAGAIAASTLLLADLGNRYVQMALIAIVWLAVLGGVDDWLKLTASSRPGGSRQGLHAWEKLVFQFGLAFLLGWFTFNLGETDAPRDLAHVLNIPFQKTYDAAGLGPSDGLIYLGRAGFIVFTILMISGMSNAVNITDGMDGLASGMSTAVGLGLLVLCLIAGERLAAHYLLMPHIPGTAELGVVAGALTGACLGFLWWNCAPASVFMGDTGALCIGGLIGYLAVAIRQEALVLLISGVMLLEIGSVALQVAYFKATGGKRIFRCAPFHWHLHMGGWSEQKIVARFWIVTVVLLALAMATIKLR
ncbi:MAG: phospho-N-acetylmuramoyl-pentapeptide-transferase [Phycisphaerales bacterium]|nr:MAG: phospho-N-acetylmuramoyl-pentapeptide-transferase [Phycisphaerales bacterium]